MSEEVEMVKDIIAEDNNKQQVQSFDVPKEDQGLTVKEAADKIEEKMDDSLRSSGEYDIADHDELPIEPAPQVANPNQQAISNAYQQFVNDANQFQADYNAVNWRELEQEDPGEAALLYQKFSARRQELQGRERQIQEAYQYESQAATLNQQRELAEFKAKEEQALLSAIPAWRDERVREREVIAVKNHLKNHGFTEHEIGWIGSKGIKYVYERMQMENRAKKQRKTIKKQKQQAQAKPVNHTPGKALNMDEAAQLLMDRWS